MKAPLYLIAGGHSAPDSISLLGKVRAATGIAAPTVAYLGAASNDDLNFFGMMKKMLSKAGFGRTELANLSAQKADVTRFKEIINGADLVFISGGDVKAGMDTLNEKGVTDFIRECYVQGKPFFGISAGSIMMGSQWVMWEDESDDNSARLFPCLGFVPFICDTHDDTGAWDELKTALGLSRTEQTGFGLPSGGGLCITPTGKWEACGCAVNRFTGCNGNVVREPDLLPVE